MKIVNMTSTEVRLSNVDGQRFPACFTWDKLDEITDSCYENTSVENVEGISMFTKDYSRYLPPQQEGVFYIVRPQDAVGMNRTDLLDPKVDGSKKFRFVDPETDVSFEVCQGFTRI